jgi:hypothetical protein
VIEFLGLEFNDLESLSLADVLFPLRTSSFCALPHFCCAHSLLQTILTLDKALRGVRQKVLDVVFNYATLNISYFIQVYSPYVVTIQDTDKGEHGSGAEGYRRGGEGGIANHISMTFRVGNEHGARSGKVRDE